MRTNPNTENPVQSDDELPEELLCPITHEPIQNPLIAPDGYTYEAAWIRDWVDKHHTSPMTRQPMELPVEVPNRQYADSVNAFERERAARRHEREQRQQAERQKNNAENRMDRMEASMHRMEQTIRDNQQTMQQMMAMMQHQNERLEHLTHYIESDRGRGYEYRYHREQRLIEDAKDAAAEGFGKGVGIGVGAAVVGAIGMGIAELGIEGGMVVALGVVSIGTVTAPVWLLLLGGTVLGGVILGGGYAAYKYFTTKDQDTIAKKSLGNQIDNVLNNLVQGAQARINITECRNTLQSLQFKLTGVVYSIYYTSAEIISRIQVVMTRWAQDMSLPASTKIGYLTYVKNGATNHIPEIILSTNPELSAISERIGYVNHAKRLPTNYDVRTQHIIDETIIHEANNAIVSAPTPEEIEGNRTALQNIIVAPIAAATTALSNGNHNPDHTHVIDVAVAMDRGFIAQQENLRAVATRVDGRVN